VFATLFHDAHRASTAKSSMRVAPLVIPLARPTSLVGVRQDLMRSASTCPDWTSALRPRKGNPMTIDPKMPAFGPASIDPRPVANSGTAPVSMTRKPAAYLAILGGLLSLLAGSTLAIRADRSLLDEQFKTTPPDVVALTRRNVECQEWLNFGVIDEATDRRAQDALLHLRCDVLAVDLARLRRRYAQSPTALQALDTAEDIGL
jgi:hypothetical protein